jgi:hypothetical protein
MLFYLPAHDPDLAHDLQCEPRHSQDHEQEHDQEQEIGGLTPAANVLAAACGHPILLRSPECVQPDASGQFVVLFSWRTQF